jgi:hypothetical protein
MSRSMNRIYTTPINRLHFSKNYLFFKLYCVTPYMYNSELIHLYVIYKLKEMDYR